MPYSLHEKSGLASVPFDPDKVLMFNKKSADPKTLKISRFIFLDEKIAVKDEAESLLLKSYEFISQKKVEEEKANIYSSEKTFKIEIENAIPEEFFPPCIKHILKGLKDGKKRSVFMLTNFLTSVGWDYDKIRVLLDGWNKKNAEPLRDNIIISHLRYHKQQKKKILPPNCDNEMYYKGLQGCFPEPLCRKIKNPVNYAILKARMMNQQEKKRKKPKAL